MRKISEPDWIRVAAIQEPDLLEITNPGSVQKREATKIVMTLIQGLIASGKVNTTTTRMIRLAATAASSVAAVKGNSDKLQAILDSLVSTLDKGEAKKERPKQLPSSTAKKSIEKVEVTGGTYQDMFENIVKKDPES